MTTTHPTKEQVRIWMTQRTHSRLPPASPEEVRRQLGWNLIQPYVRQR